MRVYNIPFTLEDLYNRKPDDDMFTITSANVRILSMIFDVTYKWYLIKGRNLVKSLRRLSL